MFQWLKNLFCRKKVQKETPEQKPVEKAVSLPKTQVTESAAVPKAHEDENEDQLDDLEVKQLSDEEMRELFSEEEDLSDPKFDELD